MKILLNIIQTNFYHGETFDFLIWCCYLVKLALENKLHNTVKFPTYYQRVYQSIQGQLLCGSYHCSLLAGWTSYGFLTYVQLKVFLLSKKSDVFAWLQKDRQTSIAHKIHLIRPDPIRWERG